VSAVTPHDVMDAAKKYLRPESMTTVVLVPSAIKETEEKAKAHARTAQQRTVIKKTLRNGIRLLITEDKSLPLVSVRVCMMGGLRAEDKKDNGISNLTADMLLKGTSSHTEEQVYSMVESLGGAISTYSSNNTLGLSLDILAKDAKKGFILLGEVLSHPRFDKKKLRVLKERVLAEIGLLEDDIFASTEKRLRAKLFPNSPYGMISKGRRSSVEKITRRQIINFYRSHCVGSNIVVSICGDIDPKKAYKWMRSSLKGVRKKKPPRLKDVKLADIDGAVEVNKKMDKQQAVAMIGFRSAGIKDPSRYPLQILSSAFSGGAGRLYTSIRHKKGLSYTLGAFGMTGMDTGSFIFYAATAPPNIDIVKDEIIAQIKKVCDGGITQEEVDSAKKELIVKHEVALQTAGSFALRTALDELYGLGFDSYRHYPDKIKGLNLQEVIQAANRYFTLNSCVISITIPKNDD